MSVAVLDFQNLSRDSGDAWLGQGIAGELTSRLGRVSRLTVASRAAVQRLRDPSALPLADVGRALNATFLVNGSVQRSGERLRVTAELVRAATGAQVWSEQFDRTETDLLAIQEAVARAVATAVAGRLLPGERAVLATRPTRNPDAYGVYLRGRTLLQGAVLRRDERAAVAAFERAVALDSTFADAWALLSRANARLYWVYADRTAARLERARFAAERARLLAPDAAGTHVALGYYYYWGRRDYAAALAELAAALAREPNNSEVHLALGAVARRQGDWDRAIASRTRAIELDPGDFNTIAERALTWTWMRRYPEAERDAARAATLDPHQMTDLYPLQMYLKRDGSVAGAPERVAAVTGDIAAVNARVFEDPEIVLPLLRIDDRVRAAVLRAAVPVDALPRAEFFMAAALAHAGNQHQPEARIAFDSARAGILRLLEARPDDDRFHAVLGIAYAGLGECDRALDAARRGTELMSMDVDAMTGAVNEGLRAQVEAQCGRTDASLARIERLLARPSPVTPALLRHDPVYAALRGHPRFERLLQ